MNVSPKLQALQDWLASSFSAEIVDYADPRQGTILSPDTDPLAVDPRQGMVLSPDTDPLAVDPRQGMVLN